MTARAPRRRRRGLSGRTLRLRRFIATTGLVHTAPSCVRWDVAQRDEKNGSERLTAPDDPRRRSLHHDSCLLLLSPGLGGGPRARSSRRSRRSGGDHERLAQPVEAGVFAFGLRRFLFPAVSHCGFLLTFAVDLAQGEAHQGAIAEHTCRQGAEADPLGDDPR